MNDALSGRRLRLLIRADLHLGYRFLLVVSGALAATVLIASIVWHEGFGPSRFPYSTCFGWVLLIWGLVASSRAFRPMHDKTRNEAYLLLPASALEKTLARLLAVTAGLVAYLLVFTFLVSGVVETFNLDSLRPPRRLLRPFRSQRRELDRPLRHLALTLFSRRGMVPEGAFRQDHPRHHPRDRGLRRLLRRHGPGRLRGLPNRYSGMRCSFSNRWGANGGSVSRRRSMQLRCCCRSRAGGSLGCA